MQPNQEHDLAQIYRSSSRIRHIVYRPDKSKQQPWASYYRGDPGMCFTTLEAARIFHFLQGDPLVITN
jgi:hypothetical protein